MPEMANAQDAPTVLLQLADHYFEVGDYDASVVEGMRFLYFEPNHPLAYYAHYRIGLAEGALGNTPQALRRLQVAARIAPNDELWKRIKYKTAVTLLQNNELELAKLELLQMIVSSTEITLATEASMLLGVTYSFQKNWKQANQTFQRSVELQSTNGAFRKYMSPAIRKIHSLEQQPIKKSPQVAKWMSTFVPGSGQMYVGRIRNGLTGLAINAGTSYLTIRAAKNGAIRNTATLAIGLWWRYYQGNRLHAEEAAIQVNERYQAETLASVYDLLQQASEQLPSRDNNEISLVEAIQNLQGY